MPSPRSAVVETKLANGMEFMAVLQDKEHPRVRIIEGDKIMPVTFNTMPVLLVAEAKARIEAAKENEWLRNFICSLIGGPMCPGQEPADLSAQKVGRAWRREHRRQYAEEALSMLALRGTSVDNDEQWEDIKRRLRSLVDDSAVIE